MTEFYTFRTGNATFINCASRKTAERHHPGAEVIVKADGGWLCFDTAGDYKTWKNQSSAAPYRNH